MSLYSEMKAQFRLCLVNSLLSDYSTIPVIFSHQSGAEPPSSYGVVNILNMDQVGKSESSSLLDEDLQLTVNTPYQALVQYSFVGPLAGDLAYFTHARLGNSVLEREYAQHFNLSVTDKSSPRRVPMKRETEWVDVFHYDVRFNFVTSIKQTVGPINRVDYVDPFTGAVVSIPPQ